MDSSRSNDAGVREAALAESSFQDSPFVDSSPPRDVSIADAASDARPEGGVCCAPNAVWAASALVTPDQSCPAWRLTDTSAADATVTGGALRIATSGDGEKICYVHGDAELNAATHIFIRFRMQFISGSSQTAARGGAGVIFAFGPDRKKGSVFFEDGHVFIAAGENTRGLTADVPTADAMHDYVIEVDVGAGTMVLSRDSRALLTASLYTNPEDATDFILWGEGSVVAQGVSLWESFSHTAYERCD